MVRVLGRQPVRPGGRLPRTSGSTRRSRTPATKTLSVAQRPPPDGDTDAAVASSPPRSTGRVDGYETSVGTFFGAGDARRARRRSPPTSSRRRSPPPSPTGAPATTLFAFRAPRRRSRPGQSVTLRYAYGMAHPAQIARRWSRSTAAQPTPLATSERAWARLGARRPTSAPSRRWVARELAVGRVPAALGLGVRGGLRPPHDHPGRLLPVRHGREPRLPQLAALRAADDLRDPELAREILRYSIVRQPPSRRRRSRTRTAPGRCARASTSARSNDLDFWLLLAAGEYGLGDARHAVLRRAGAVLRRRRDGDARGSTSRTPFAHQETPARPARRLPHRRDRRLVRLLDRSSCR